MGTPTAPAAPLLSVENLHTHFVARGGRRGARGLIKAVDGVSFQVARRRTLGIAGESGCGKSTLARTILRLIPATSGRVLFDGRDVFALPASELRGLRRRMQIVFQDPVGSLNPRLRVETLVGEALRVHGVVRNRREQRERVAALLTRVGLAADDATRYPHEFSGGQRQRIGIARALALEPELVICDEPVSALDVSIQAQVLNLLADLQRGLGLSYIFIAHNLAVVRHISDEVAVMYRGRIVEQGENEALFGNPRHPYTRLLLASVPAPDVALPGRSAPDAETRAPPLAEMNVRAADWSGCAFSDRCPIAEPRCQVQAPSLLPVAGDAPTHQVACFRTNDTPTP